MCSKCYEDIRKTGPCRKPTVTNRISDIGKAIPEGGDHGLAWRIRNLQDTLLEFNEVVLRLESALEPILHRNEAGLASEWFKEGTRPGLVEASILSDRVDQCQALAGDLMVYIDNLPSRLDL